MTVEVCKRERFDIRREPDETWTVFDIFSGLPVFWGGLMLSNLGVAEAFSIVDEMNELDLDRRERLGF